MMRPSSPRLAFSVVLLLASMVAGCGSEEAGAGGSAASSTRAAIVDACAVLNAESFASIVGSPVHAYGGINDMGARGWTSSCSFQNDGAVHVLLNDMLPPETTTARLIDRLERHAGEGGAAARPAEGFPAPAAEYFTDEGDLHVVIVRHGDYWVQSMADDIETARRGMTVTLAGLP